MKKQHVHWLKNGLKNAAFAGACMLSSQALASVAYVDHHYSVKQPDGSSLEIVLNGSSHYGDQRTTDGYPLVYDKDKKGYTYAKLSSNGEKFVSSGILAIKANRSKLKGLNKDIDIPRSTKVAIGQRNALKRQIHKEHGEGQNKGQDKVNTQMTGTLALTGEVKGLTILIQFPDQTGTIAQSDVNNYANQIGYTGFGNSQSIRGYFRSVSGDKLDYTNTVTQYFTASKNKSYYTDPNVGFGTRAQELIHEALTWLKNTQGYNFSALSTDSSGNIRGLNVFYAGETDGGWSQGLWPHMGGFNQSFCANGVCATQYQITNMSDALSIGTFIHESGHLIADWPDLYDYDGSSDGSAAGFCVMGYGAIGEQSRFKPVPPNGYFRQLAGWETTTELNPAVNSNAPTGTLSHQANSNTLYRWSNPNKADEAFYVETYTKSGQSEFLPDEGLVVWHVDGDGTNSNEWHPLVQMEHADAARDPEKKVNRGDQFDMYDASMQDAFGYSVPSTGNNRSTNSRWWNGADSNFEISNIGAVANTMNFTVGGGVVDPEPVIVELTNGATTSVADLTAGQNKAFRLDVPAGATNVTFTLTGNNGDADLYVKKGAVGTSSDNDCKSTGSNSNETCTLAATEGVYYAVVDAYSSFSGLQIKGEYTTDTGGGNTQRYTGNLTGANDKDIHPDGSYFQYNGGTITGVLSGPSNADFDLVLFKWSNSRWTKVVGAETASSEESISYNATSGYYQFEIKSYSGSGNYTFDLTK